MKPDTAFDELARAIASTICDDFTEYNTEFRAITRRARTRFETRDWKGSQRDAVERIELYDITVKRSTLELKLRLGHLCKNKTLWIKTKAAYAERVNHFPDSDFYKTFFGSIARGIFETIGIDRDVESLAVDFEPAARQSGALKAEAYIYRNSKQDLFRRILTDFSFSVPYRNIDADIEFLTREVKEYRRRNNFTGTIDRVEIIRPVFHQLTRAYLVGRLIGQDITLPFILSLENTTDGIAVDAVMMTQNEAGILFSFTRSYFHVDLERVSDAVEFLRSIMPGKAAGELYTVLGRAKQGKLVRYRNLLNHLRKSHDCFVHAPGDKGLVMVVFTLPSYDIVVKLIRDRFAPPKTSSRQDVLDKYQLVFKHDRAGRLIDAQEFRYLSFKKDRFCEELLDELIHETAESIRIVDDNVILKHCYIERRLTPLNLYLQKADPVAAQKVVYDYGQAIRDLALCNIFPGDLLIKNFGVTRYGRVIFYDYDELCMVTDCNFREIPPPQSMEDEMRSETWFYVADNDVFPEQFIAFLGFGKELDSFFLEWHGEILTARYWRDLQTRHRMGQVLDVLPYHRYPVNPV
ncbi:MAG: bifunctional isocitrate dehydrogenase kinase/phosphatase [Methylococcaceae bacterium]|nr:bifunctional isocitrate dehydrogenase kinase/phosphatase [Methylococcaceae bacterium]